MAAVGRQHHRLAAFGHDRSGLALERDMTDDLAFAVARYRREKLAALDLVPVATGREHLGMHVVMPVDFQEAASDPCRVVLLRQVDEIVARWGRVAGAAGGASTADWRRLGVSGQAAVKADLPSVDAMFVAGYTRVAPDAAGERRRDARKAGMTGQQDLRPDVAVRAQQYRGGRARDRCPGHIARARPARCLRRAGSRRTSLRPRRAMPRGQRRARVRRARVQAPTAARKSVEQRAMSRCRRSGSVARAVLAPFYDSVVNETCLRPVENRIPSEASS